ncbi:MAG TPA: NADH-quinone oxidoreductase subunit L [Verrucomicrobiae bacterium]|jgi:NADH-quinone oxidoreductase subunit L|nr:NADH-quinone oxidoreductase subunit L [Verrucomicrobiae bacterium]
MAHLENLAWLILFLPLFSAVIITVFTRAKPVASAQISIGAVVVSFVLTCILFVVLHSSGATTLRDTSYSWLSVGDLDVSIGLKLDYLSLTMALIVTGVGSLIHIYSSKYMEGDGAYYRYFACLSLFTFSMLGIVLANNFLMMFIFWELVGVSSYLLIGFWYEKASAADACKKAFITNRLGDFGFLLGILLVWATLGHHLNFEDLRAYLGNHTAEYGVVATIAGLLIFCGAAGKSAQFPLHVWLPDAMEGPTPVSALIHAATMVAAGVYMLCRVFFLLNVSDSFALEVIAWIGGFTALLAALIAVQQNDIKRILAYSTLSQLGYMVMAVGMGGPTEAMYHLTTHAFFKALLFLGAGSVIYAVHHEQNIWKMGALRKKLPVTFWTFIVGTLALCGMWPLSGFFSKDGILGLALEKNHIALFVLGAGVAFLTTFYMSRLVFVAFFGGERSHAAEHPHESPGIMLWPLRILAVLSAIGGVIGIEGIYQRAFEPNTVLESGGFLGQIPARLLGPFDAQPLGAVIGLGCVIFGALLAWSLYGSASVDPLPSKLGWLSRAMRNRFYFDEFYEHVLIPYTQEAASKIADAFDRMIIAGLGVRGTEGTTDLFGRALRLAQNGSIQTYAFLLVAGLAVVLYFVLAQ